MPPPAPSPRARAFLEQIAAPLGVTVDKVVEYSLPLPDSPPDYESWLTLDAAGDITALELNRSYLPRSPHWPAELALRDAPALVHLTIVLEVLDGLRRLEVTGMPRLESLRCHVLGLESLVLAGLPALADLDAYGNALATIDLGGAPALRVVNLSRNRLSRVALPAGVERVYLGDNAIDALDPPGPSLRELGLERNRLTALDVSACPALERLDCSGNRVGALDVSRNPRLETLSAKGCDLESLDLRGNPGLEYLFAEGNRFEGLDLRSTPRLACLWCSRNRLRSLDLSAVPAVKSLKCDENPLGTLDLRPLAGLEEAALPPLAEGRLLVSEFQKRRVPALRERYGVRKPPRAVARMDAFELHLAALAHNRDDGHKKLVTIAKCAACDFGTALLMYWRTDPHHTPASDGDAQSLLRTIEKRAAEDAYRTRLFPFDPRRDGSTDLTRVKEPPGRQVPAALLVACPGGEGS